MLSTINLSFSRLFGENLGFPKFVTREAEERPLVTQMVRSLMFGAGTASAGAEVERWVLVSFKGNEVEVISVTNDDEEIERNLDELDFEEAGSGLEGVLEGGRGSFKIF